MTDHTELKRLAEALGGATWLLVDGDGFEADNRFVTSQQRIDDNKVAFAEINYGHPEAGMGEPFQSQQVTAGEFIAAANPAAVLDLIAENERLTNALHEARQDRNKIGDRYDACSAEVAGLKTGYEAYERVNAELRAEVARLSSKSISASQIPDILSRHRREVAAESCAMKREGMAEAQKACDRFAGDSLGRSDLERKGAGECSAAIRALIAAMGKGEQS